MLPYRVQYNESESDTKKYNLFYKKHPQSQHIFEMLKSKSTVYPQNRHAQTFLDTHRVQNSGEHFQTKNPTNIPKFKEKIQKNFQNGAGGHQNGAGGHQNGAGGTRMEPGAPIRRQNKGKGGYWSALKMTNLPF